MKIEVKNLTKKFEETTAIDDISLCFEENKIYGLLGRNGAGKSTLLNIITNRIFQNSGEVIIDNMDNRNNDKALHNIYLMSEKNYYPNNMTIKEIFQWSQEFYNSFNMPYALKLSNEFGLNVKKKLKEISTGYSSIFKIIIALSLDVPFVFLDEPVLGLDANHRELFYKRLLENYIDNPRTFVISTHLIEEISTLIEDIIIIKEGKIIKNQSCEELLESGYTVSGLASSVDDFISDKNVIGTDILGGLKSAYVLGNRKDITDETITKDLEISKLDLQKLFIHLTNK